MLFKCAVKYLAMLFFWCNVDLFINKKKIVVLMYHGVTTNVVNRDGENYDGKHVFVEKFEAQLKYLLGRYDFLTFEDFFYILDAKKKMPNNSVLLTFDDGYLNNFEVLFPVLKKYDIPATIFVCPGLIGKGRPNWPDLVEWCIVHSEKKEIIVGGVVFSLVPAAKKVSIIEIKNLLFNLPSSKRWKVIDELVKSLNVREQFSGNYQLMGWEEIKEMKGISFGSHSLTHPILPIEAIETIREEVGVSKEILERKLGCAVRAFAYPNGVFDERTKECVREVGYSCAFAVKWGKVSKNSDRFALERIPVNGNDSAEFFFLNLMVNAHRLVQKLRSMI